MSAPTVFLTDLRHNYAGVIANECMPLGVGYMKAAMDRDLPEASARAFAYPDRLWDAMVEQPPDVLMLSNYVWNEALSHHFASAAKRMNPNALVVMGGPNIPTEPERQIGYLEAHPDLDIYVTGEGDFLATEIVQHYLDGGKSLAKLRQVEFPSSVQRGEGPGEFRRSTIAARRRSLDEIPSPWLTGVLDEFFDGKLAPLIETNRGCPFTCTFCVQGVDWYTKVNYFDKDRIKEELHYIASKVREVCPSMGLLRIADSNYGMFERDIDISAYIGKLMKDFGYPAYIDATTGKNRPERILKSVEEAGGALLLYQAVQSLDEDVLKNVKRSQIKLDTYRQILGHMRGRGLRSNSDLILGLPGETLSSHVKGLHGLLDTGVSQVTNFQLMLLKGSELETLESRKEFDFSSRFRVLPKNFGIYGDGAVFDVEEVVVSTETLSFEDYIQARKYAFVSVVFWHDNLLEDALAFGESQGMKRSEWLDAVLEALEADDGLAHDTLYEFVEETKNELFPTREACVEFYSREENFERLRRGQIGDNLTQKYRAIGTLRRWPEVCKIGMDVTRNLLLASGADQRIEDFEEFWADFHRYVEHKHAHGASSDEILRPLTATLRYDFDAWLADSDERTVGCDVEFSSPAEYRLAQPSEFVFKLKPEAAREMRKAFETWSNSLMGLSKLLTRIQLTWLMRTCRATLETAHPSPGDSPAETTVGFAGL